MSDESATKPPARLEIKVGDDVHVVLEGDPAFVMEAYRQVQDDVARAVASAAEHAPDEAPSAMSPRDTFDEDEAAAFEHSDPKMGAAPAVEDPAAGFDELDARGSVVWLYKCDDDMRTVYANDRSVFDNTPFAKAYGLAGIKRVYIEDERILRALRGRSRTLWREMEPEAMERIREVARHADAVRAASKEGAPVDEGASSADD
jgi:hypothetical protein